MSEVVEFSRNIYETVFDPFGTATSGGFSPLSRRRQKRTPRIPRQPQVDPEEQREAADAAAERRRRRTIGAFGVSDTNVTGGVTEQHKGSNSLLGG